MEWISRTKMLLGEENINKLANSNIIVFGVGGVGSYVCEALARAGIGNITIVDNDTVSISNINRQIVALNSTIGMYKTEVMKNRILDINPNCNVKCINEFVLRENVISIIDLKYDYCIDAIDTVTAKLSIIERCNELEIPIISSMGTGNKLHPELLEITDIFKTSVCPLAKVMRKELKNRNIKKLKVCYSKEQPLIPINPEFTNTNKQVPGSISFVPSIAGLLIASEVINNICNI